MVGGRVVAYAFQSGDIDLAEFKAFFYEGSPIDTTILPLDAAPNPNIEDAAAGLLANRGDADEGNLVEPMESMEEKGDCLKKV